MTMSPEYFERRWETGDDPWLIADRWYERRKRDLVTAVLPRERFRRGLEVGCAAGHLTARLAQRCDVLLACDGNPRAVALTAERTADQLHVQVVQRWIPEQWPDGAFDLVVVSELGYYLGSDDLDDLAGRAGRSLAADGVLLACHWRHPAPRHPATAETVHAAFAARGLAAVAHHVEPDLVLDVWTRGEPSVARAEGWLE